MSLFEKSADKVNAPVAALQLPIPAFGDISKAANDVRTPG